MTTRTQADERRRRKVRMNVLVAEDTPAKLAELAGGYRRRGAYLTRLVDALYEAEGGVGGDLKVLALAAEVAALRRELEALKAARGSRDGG